MEWSDVAVQQKEEMGDNSIDKKIRKLVVKSLLFVDLIICCNKS